MGTGWDGGSPHGGGRFRRPRGRRPAPMGGGHRLLRFEPLEDRRLLAVFEVNSLLDTVDANPGDGLAEDASGATTLRAAIMEGNALPGADEIHLPAGAYPLTIGGSGEDAAATGDLDVTDGLTLIGSGAAETVIDALGVGDRVFHVHGLLHLQGLTITGGVASGGGADDDFGGGIFVDDLAEATVTECVLRGNSAPRTSGTSAYGRGGAISADGALTVRLSTFEDNHASDRGGAVHVHETSASAVIEDCTFSDNSASKGGAIFNSTSMFIDNSTFDENFTTSLSGGGGAIHNNDTASLMLTNSTMSGNTGSRGGGIISFESVEIVNCTITGNSASYEGGGVFGWGEMLLRNTIVADNSAGGGGPDVYGEVNSLGYNLVGDTAGSSGFGAAGDLLNADPLLGPLADNGGPTWTHALLPGSPAIDAADTAAAPPIDQRGVTRPQGDAADIGAYEVATPTATEIALDGSGNLTIREGGLGATDDALLLAIDGTDLIAVDSNGNAIGITGFAAGDFSGSGTSEVRIKLSAAGWTGGILVDTGNGDDTIRIEGIDLGRSADLVIDSGAGSDAVVFETAATNSRGGDLSVTAGEITLDAPVSTEGGDVSLAADGDVTVNHMVETGGGGLSVHADSDGDGSGTFTVVTDPSGFLEQAVLRASDTQRGDWFGYSVAISGDTAIVGADREGGGEGNPSAFSGAAYVFARDAGGAWTEQAVLRASDAQPFDAFGKSVAISGNTAIAGAFKEDGGAGDTALESGAAYVFTRDARGMWSEQAVLRASDAQAEDRFGNSVSISGDTAVVGAYREDGGPGDSTWDSGAAYVFTRDMGGAWTERAVLRPSDAQADDWFGYSVAVSGDTAIVGAYHEDGGPGDPASESGAAYVFTRDGSGMWTEQAVLRASDAQMGDRFGYSVSLSAQTAIVGAYYEDGGAGEPIVTSGAAYVFARDIGGAWTEQAVLRASDAQVNDRFGISVSISGDTAIVGADYEEGGAGNPITYSGAAYVFSRHAGGAWTEQSVLHASDAQAHDYFGRSVSISGDTAIVGAFGEDGGTGDLGLENGAAYICWAQDPAPRALSTGGGDVSITAADVELGGLLDAGAGAVSFKPSTAGRIVDLGADGGGQFVLTNRELNRITTTNRFAIGDTATGDVTFTGAVYLTGNTPRLEIHSDGATARIGDTNTRGPDVIVPYLILDGNVAPGTSPGILSASGDVALTDGSTFSVEFGGTTPGYFDTHHDQLSAAGTVSIGANVTLSLTAFDNFTPSPGDEFVIINTDVGVTGTFAGLPEGATMDNFLRSGLDATISYTGGSDNNDVAIFVPPILDVDLSGAADALTDGILILRYLFGFTGGALVEDALSQAATRSNPAAIAAFLDTCRDTMLDVDASGEADALTDGILILRHLFGFTGDALIEDALAPDAMRTDPDEVAAFLDQFVPGVQGASATTFAPLDGESVERTTPTTQPISTDAERINAAWSDLSQDGQDDQWVNADRARRAALYRALAYDAAGSRAKVKKHQKPAADGVDLLMLRPR